MKKTNSVVCPHCGASDLMVVSAEIFKCNYCGSTINIPKEAKKVDPNDPFASLSQLFSSFEVKKDPRGEATNPLRRQLTSGEAKNFSRFAFNKTKPYWIVSLVLAVVSIVLCIVHCAVWLGLAGCVSSLVCGVLGLGLFIFTAVKNSKEIEKQIIPLQNEIIENVRKDIDNKKLIPLTEEEVALSKKRLGMRTAYASKKANFLQVICGILNVGFIVTIIIMIKELVLAAIRA